MTLEAKDVLPNINRMQAAKGPKKIPVFVPSDLDLWPSPSNLSERGTKHVFRVNFAQIRSAVPEIFHTQTKTTDWRCQKQNLQECTIVHCVR